MKKIFSVIFIAITALFIFSCLDAAEEEKVPPAVTASRVEGGGDIHSPFTINGVNLNGVAAGRANGYKDRNNERRVKVTLWVLKGVIQEVNVDTSYETRGYGWHYGDMVHNFIVEHNTVDLKLSDFDAATRASPYGGDSMVTFNAILTAAHEALGIIAANNIEVKGGGDARWTYHGKPLDIESDPIPWRGWMPHAAGGRTNTVVLTLEDGFITKLTWSTNRTASNNAGAVHDWDCFTYGRPALQRIENRVVKYNTYDIDKSKIQNSAGFTFAVDTDDDVVADVRTQATATIDLALPPIKEAFIDALLKFAKSQ